jgi:hypothetical protein
LKFAKKNATFVAAFGISFCHSFAFISSPNDLLAQLRRRWLAKEIKIKVELGMIHFHDGAHHNIVACYRQH